MTRCAHPDWHRVTITVADYELRLGPLAIFLDRKTSDPVARRCSKCLRWLSLGEADEQNDIEIWLAEALAESYARDWETLLEYMPDLEAASDEDREAVLSLYEEGLVERALDGDAEREERQRRPPRPRSPIEMMVDQACGIEVRDGVIYELGGQTR